MIIIIIEDSIYLSNDPKECNSDPFEEIHASQATSNNWQEAQIPQEVLCKIHVR